MSTDTVTTLPGAESDASDRAITERIERILAPSFESLAHYLKTGQGDPRDEIIADALILTDALGQGQDGPDPDSMWLLQRILMLGGSISQFESDRREAEREARREQEEADRAARDQSPSAKVEVLAFMTGIDARSRVHTEKMLTELEAQAPGAAEIARRTIAVGPGASLEIGDGRATLNDAEGQQVGSWEIDADTAGALQPLVPIDDGLLAAEGGSDE